MAQIWLTYEELAELCISSPEAARSAVIANGWTRRRCRDGLTRAKLPQFVANAYMAHCVLHSDDFVRFEHVFSEVAPASHQTKPTQSHQLCAA